MTDYVLTLRCLDQPGIVNALTTGLLDCGGNILTQAQFTDPELGLFFLRTTFETSESDVDNVRDAIAQRVSRFDPLLTVRPLQQRRRILIMVSKFDHCLVDLLYRHKTGELPVDIPLVVGNHETCRAQATEHGVPFVHLPVTPDTKEVAEKQLLDLVAEHRVDTVVLARYMQIISDDLCRRLSGRIVNIHHSFLPGFKGARPYHQAHSRGVKLIGATAHYVTADLDEGPIIEQDVQRVAHDQTAPDFVEIGRDTERRVLARAVRLVAEDRVLLAGSRTVVFS